MSNELRVAIGAAKKGAEYAMRFFGTELKVSKKDDNSVFTDVDKDTEKIIKKTIIDKFPNAKFVAEESGGNRKEKEFWIIDPIDGTRSFTRGIPTWCVLIAYYKNGQITLGVCYFPIFKWLVYAELNKGAFFNGEKVKVSKIKNLEDATITCGTLKYFKNETLLIRLIDASAALRAPDHAFSCLFLAKGCFDVLVDTYGMIWDIAPFKVIIEEAGGKVTNWKGEPWTIADRGCIATNGILHHQVMKIIEKLLLLDNF